MLLGKLATPATKVFQNGAFGSRIETADYMVVSTKRYVIGDGITEFDVRFGNVITENGKERFDILLREHVEMSSEELISWGTDDSVLLDLIAAKLNTTLTDKIFKDLHFTY